MAFKSALYRFAPMRASAKFAGFLIEQADRARDARRFRDAATLYEEALKLHPHDGPVHVQCGHMFKESGDLREAEAHYGQAFRLMPDDPELALQLGHFFKIAGRLEEAEFHYRRAVRFRPDWSDPATELRSLEESAVGWAQISEPNGASPQDFDELVPELVPSPGREAVAGIASGLSLRRLGRMERGPWGTLRTLRGVEAIRGYSLESGELAELEVLLDDRALACIALQTDSKRDSRGRRKYVFNIWHDFTNEQAGPGTLTFRFRSAHAEVVRTSRERVVVAQPLREIDHPSSDGVVTSAEGSSKLLTEDINRRPSVVRSARRELFEKPPRNILVQRVDQLGDMVCSIPAVRRLREIFPQARLIGLLSPANAELAETLGLFDEVIVVTFPDDPVERRRTMPLAEQKVLRETLHRFEFDLAIDLSESAVSRPLLILSGARFLYGFRHGEFPWLSAGFDGGTRDIADGLERVPHTNKVMGLIEWLNVIGGSYASVVRRPNLDPAVLVPFGLSATDRFIVLHTGARLAFSRWPHYEALASSLLEHTDLKVVIIADDPCPTLPNELLNSPRFMMLDRRLTFDQLDGLVSFCQAFVGNDSGPKHLAALRGAKVVSIHLARINWNEWGQENSGYIISRKVPCAGCSIHHDPEECGKDFACITNIRTEEVLNATLAALGFKPGEPRSTAAMDAGSKTSYRFEG